MKYTYQTQGTCSSLIEVEICEEGGRKVVKDVKFTGGCNGNLQGIGALVKGMPVEDVVARLEGIKCKTKPTSCPDQLAIAIKTMMEK